MKPQSCSVYSFKAKWLLYNDIYTVIKNLSILSNLNTNGLVLLVVTDRVVIQAETKCKETYLHITTKARHWMFSVAGSYFQH